MEKESAARLDRRDTHTHPPHGRRDDEFWAVIQKYAAIEIGRWQECWNVLPHLSYLPTPAQTSNKFIISRGGLRQDDDDDDETIEKSGAGLGLLPLFSPPTLLLLHVSKDPVQRYAC